MNKYTYKYITPIGNDGIYVLDTASWRVFRPVMNKEKCVELFVLIMNLENLMKADDVALLQFRVVNMNLPVML